jgi:hypothetical protein
MNRSVPPKRARLLPALEYGWRSGGLRLWQCDRVVNYAVLQQTLDIPDVERLKRAFRGQPGLVPADAHSLANDAYGILVKGQSAEDARSLCEALRREGVGTLVVAESELPVLPPTKFLHRVECLPDGLRVYDTIGRDFMVEWGHVMLIAAGSVRKSEFKRIEETSTVTRYTASRTPVRETVTDVSYKEQQLPQLMIELILGRAAARLSITADKQSGLLFQYLGERRTASLPENFAVLVRDLARFAPHAMLNRGAFQLRDGTDQIFAYPSKNAFFEEITWLLWHWLAGSCRES